MTIGAQCVCVSVLCLYIHSGPSGPLHLHSQCAHNTTHHQPYLPQRHRPHIKQTLPTQTHFLKKKSCSIRLTLVYSVTHPWSSSARAQAVWHTRSSYLLSSSPSSFLLCFLFKKVWLVVYPKLFLELETLSPFLCSQKFVEKRPRRHRKIKMIENISTESVQVELLSQQTDINKTVKQEHLLCTASLRGSITMSRQGRTWTLPYSLQLKNIHDNKKTPLRKSKSPTAKCLTITRHVRSHVRRM